MCLGCEGPSIAELCSARARGTFLSTYHLLTYYGACQVRDARLQLFAAAKRRAEEAAAAGQRTALTALRMRGETLGTDRWGRRYWRLADQRVWVQPRTPGLAAVVQAVAPDAAGDDAWQLFEGAEVRRSPRHEAGPRMLYT